VKLKKCNTKKSSRQQNDIIDSDSYRKSCSWHCSTTAVVQAPSSALTVHIFNMTTQNEFNRK